MPSPTPPCPENLWWFYTWPSLKTFLTTYRYRDCYFSYRTSHCTPYGWNVRAIVNQRIMSTSCLLCVLEHRTWVRYTWRGGGCQQGERGRLLLHLLHPGWTPGGGAGQLPHQEGRARASGKFCDVVNLTNGQNRYYSFRILKCSAPFCRFLVCFSNGIEEVKLKVLNVSDGTIKEKKNEINLSSLSKFWVTCEAPNPHLENHRSSFYSDQRKVMLIYIWRSFCYSLILVFFYWVAVQTWQLLPILVQYFYSLKQSIHVAS